jgi:adenylate cyclase
MSRRLKAILLGLLVGVAGLIVSPFHFTLGIEENTGLGLLFKLRGAGKAPRDAVVVSIDRESSEQLNLPDNPDKWPRSLHARLTDTLLGKGARVVVFDLHFIEPRSDKDDSLFAKAMEKARNVVICEPVRTGEVPLSGGDGSSYSSNHNIVKVVPPIDRFCNSAVATAPFTLPRIPFKVAQCFTFDPGAGDSPSMPMVALQLYAAQAFEDFLRLLEKASPGQSGKLPIDCSTAIETRSVKELMRKIREIFEADPLIAERMLRELEGAKALSGDAYKYRMIKSLINMYRGPNHRYINFYGPPRTITTIPYHQALKLREGAEGYGKIDLKDKAVFVGLSESLLAERKDSFYTVFSRANGIFIGGVEIAATAFANLLEDTPVRPVGLSAYFLVILCWGIIAGFLCRMASVGAAALGIAGLCALYLAGAWYAFKTSDIWLPIVVPLLFQTPLAFFGGVIWNHVDTKKEHQKIRKAFEYYLPKDVVDQLVKNLGDVGAGSRTVYGVCLFTDAEHYTTLSETLDPKELGIFMNRYYETLFKPVKRHGGVVSNLAGDSMLAIWVATTPEAALRDKACLAAIDIDRAVKELYDPSDPLRLNTRIGLHYGDLFLGNIGGVDHYQHSAMGDIVNTASRIEGLNKHLGTRLLVSEEVIDQRSGFLTRELGTFRLKGKNKPIGIYELVCRIEEADGNQRRACGIFAESLDAFRRGSWNEATEKFHRIIESVGEDEPSRFYINLCERYEKHPPEGPWDGVVSMDRK